MEDNRLTITDLTAIHRIIDTACTRGAFKGSEMSEVGMIYDKLESFLTTIQAQAKAQAEANTQGDTNA